MTNTERLLTIDFDQLMLFDKNITGWSSDADNPNKHQFEIEVKWSSDMDDVTKEELECSWKVIGTTPE